MKPLANVNTVPMLPKLKFPKTRSRKSPPVGPSPLRTMILPDLSSGSAIGSPNEMEVTKNSLDPHGVLPSDVLSPNPLPGSSRMLTDNNKGCLPCSAKKQDNDGTDALLGIIRELVEETGDWDDDLSMKDNFKSLMRNAVGEVVESEESSGTGSRSRSSDSSGTSNTDVDLGLLGLDRFKDDYSNGRDYEPEGAREDSAMDLVSSFWADSAGDVTDGKQK
jgi:hypothetical protein